MATRPGLTGSITGGGAFAPKGDGGGSPVAQSPRPSSYRWRFRATDTWKALVLFLVRLTYGG
jgi:hypothetical protein